MEAINKKVMAPDFWDDSDAAQSIMVELNAKKGTIDTFETIFGSFSDIRDIIDILDEDEFQEEKATLSKDIETLNHDLGELSKQTLLSGEYDTNDCFVSIHAGTGGTEAMDWAGMLMRMYQRWFQSKEWKATVTDINSEETGGIKSVQFEVKGYYAYGMCKGEKGVHRLVRISPYDSQSRRQTSFASVDVYPVIKDIANIEIADKDIKVDTYRATGAGGQHVNTTDSAVRVTHLPTGIVVTCQNERSQIQNRAKAMEMLIAKLVQIKEEEHREKIEDIQGTYKQIAWGSQIRSYVFQPYTLVKDHRTGEETGNIQKVMDGDVDPFVDAYLNWNAQQGKEE